MIFQGPSQPGLFYSSMILYIPALMKPYTYKSQLALENEQLLLFQFNKKGNPNNKKKTDLVWSWPEKQLKILKFEDENDFFMAWSSQESDC